jgi:hypothetical protein
VRIKGEHLGPIPEGHQIYADRLEVMGVVKRKADATRFVRGRDQRLEIEQDPDNPVDRNALNVIGCWKGWFLEHRGHLGYVPRDVAKVVQERVPIRKPVERESSEGRPERLKGSETRPGW